MSLAGKRSPRRRGSRRACRGGTEVSPCRATPDRVKTTEPVGQAVVAAGREVLGERARTGGEVGDAEHAVRLADEEVALSGLTPSASGSGWCSPRWAARRRSPDRSPPPCW